MINATCLPDRVQLICWPRGCRQACREDGSVETERPRPEFPGGAASDYSRFKKSLPFETFNACELDTFTFCRLEVAARILGQSDILLAILINALFKDFSFIKMQGPA